MAHTNFLNNCISKYFAIIQDAYDESDTMDEETFGIKMDECHDKYFHEFIDYNVSTEYNGDIEEIVASYGIEKAYQLYIRTFGELTLKEKICPQLAYAILDEALFASWKYANYVEWFNINSP